MTGPSPCYHPASLRRRLIVTFVGFGVVLGLLMCTAIIAMMHITEDRLLQARLAEELEHVLADVTTDPATPLPNTRFINGFWQDKLPNDDVGHFAAALAPGFYEFGDDGVNEYHIAVTDPIHGRRLVLFYDVSELEQSEAQLQPVLVAATALTTICGLVLGVLVANKVFQPLGRLGRLLESSPPDRLPAGFSSAFGNDEIGRLAAHLDRALTRVRAFVERERRFTREASHELRTPVTVARGAVELLQSTVPATGQRALERLDRAVRDMEYLIGVFLWLGREESTEPPVADDCDLAECVRNRIADHTYLLQGRQVHIHQHGLAHAPLTAPKAALDIVVANLVRNAFQHCTDGAIEITIEAQALTIVNQRAAIDGDGSRGYGLGLDIVRRIAARLGWRFTLDTQGPQVRSRLDLSTAI